MGSTRHVTLLAISGSLRSASSNTLLLEAAAREAPQGIVFELYQSLSELPYFSPDLDPGRFPSVMHLIDKVRAAHGLVVSTPEYAHGIPGALKNGLDWLVGSDAFISKPFMLLNASNRSLHAQQSLVEILKTMSGVEIADATTTIPLLGKGFDQIATFLQSPENVRRIRTSLDVFANSIRLMNGNRSSGFNL